MTNGAIILGAGLAGLSAAYHLGGNYEIYEKESEVGGLCRSKRVNGFTFDYAVHAFYSRDEYASALANKLLTGNLLQHNRSAFIHSKGVFTPYPFQANTAGLPAETMKECVLGFIQAACSADEQKTTANFEEWIYSTFGDGIARHFMIPFNEKLWGVDLREMSACWIRDRVPQPGLVEVIAGALSRQSREFGANAQFCYPKTGGMSALPEAFLPYIHNLHLNQEAVAIRSHERRIILADGRSRRYDKLISSLPLNRLVDITTPVPDRIREAADQLRRNAIYAVNIGVKRANISDMHWVYFPEPEFIFYRVSFPMNFSSAMVPEGASSISVEISASANKSVDVREQAETVIGDLIRAQILKEDDEILATDLMKMEPAYIIYDHSRQRNVTLIREFLEAHDIYPCGRFGEWEYHNMDHAILSGKATAERIENL